MRTCLSSIGQRAGARSAVRRVSVALLLAVLVPASAGLAACGGASGPQDSVEAPATAGATAAGATAAGAAAAEGTTAAAERPVIGPDGDVVRGADAVYRDLAYDDESPLQGLDIYLPDNGSRPYPVLVAIHGGGFSFGDKEDGQIIPVLAGLTRGYAVVGIDYRLSPESTFPAAISDVKAAIRWLRAHAGEYGLDGSRIALWGDSAGGNLAALAGTAGDSDALRGPDPANADQPETVQAVVDWFGPVSFLHTDGDFREAGFDRPSALDRRSFLSEYLGAALDEVPGKVRASDPITYLTPGDPPILIEHGTADGTVPYPQSIRLARAYAEVAGEDSVTLRLLRGAGHVDPVFYSEEHLDEVLDWLDARLK
jgi:acetyl esterase/lipase